MSGRAAQRDKHVDDRLRHAVLAVKNARKKEEEQALLVVPAMIRMSCVIALLLLLTASAAGAQQNPQQNAPNAPQVPPAAAPPPFPNRANDVLPSWLRLRGEFRERVEGFSNAGFTSGRDDLYGLSRLRLNAAITPSRVLAFHVQAQDARVARKEIGPTGLPFAGPFDLRMAFADLGTATSPVAVRVGRQELAFGEQRLVGHVSWLNTARTFDGARVSLRSKLLQVELFGTSVVRILDKEFDKSGNGHRFFGAYASTDAVVPRGSVEPYVFWRGDRYLLAESGLSGDLEQTTVGVRWTGRLPARLDYGTEMAVQTGSLGPDSIRAWAGHWQLRESFPGAAAVRVSAEYNFASGDSDPADGTRGTFDQLYPTGHDKYGLADQVGWRNIHHARAGVELSPWKKWQVGGNYHSWWVAETRDGVYTAGGTLLARVGAGAGSTHVGQELDVQASRALTLQLQLGAGYAHIFPGGFLREATPGASYRYPYVTVTYVFLAEK